ncbi:MAG TPA: hypothetical protein VIT38_11855 [Allosphingosinicella sp.]
MSSRWADVAFVPDSELAAKIVAAWQWLVPGGWTPFLCSMTGDIFLEEESGVYWLQSGSGQVERIARNADEFETIVHSQLDKFEEWFLPGLVEALHDAGKRPDPGECYAFQVLPVFAEGKYEPDNLVVRPAVVQLVGMAAIHEQIADVPDGGQVQIKIGD